MSQDDEMRTLQRSADLLRLADTSIIRDPSNSLRSASRTARTGSGPIASYSFDTPAESITSSIIKSQPSKIRDTIQKEINYKENTQQARKSGKSNNGMQ